MNNIFRHRTTRTNIRRRATSSFKNPEPRPLSRSLYLQTPTSLTMPWVGRESLYEFKPKAIDGIKTYLDNVSQQWDEALGRLKSLVER